MNSRLAWRKASRALPAAFLLLSGCGGFGGYISDTFWRGGDPHAPRGNSLTIERARGNAPAVPLILPVQGDIWPHAVQTVPTLADIERGMNRPASETGSRHPGPPASAHARAVRPADSAAPASNQSGVAMAPRISPARPARPPPNTKSPNTKSLASPFRLGDTIMTPNGPGGVVSSDNAGGYQTVAPVGGRGGGILVPTGHGSATLIGPNGQVSPVIPPR
jgi:hypothetical protein